MKTDAFQANVGSKTPSQDSIVFDRRPWQAAERAARKVVLLVVAGGCLAAAPLWGQRSAEEKPSATNPQNGKQETVLAIVGAEIHTVSRERIRRGTIVIRGTKIDAVGEHVEVPAGAEVIDASGRQVTPGFIALSASRLGVVTSSSRNAQLEDGLDPFDRDLKLALGVGITTVCVEAQTSRFSFRGRDSQVENGVRPLIETSPTLDSSQEPFNPDFGIPEPAVCACCGLTILPAGPLEPITPSSSTNLTPRSDAVLKLTFGELDGMLVTTSPFYHLPFGALSGSLNRHLWRGQIAKARKYLGDQAEHEKAIQAGKKEKPPRKTVSDELIKLVKGEIFLRVQADRVDEIRDMVALSEELDYRLLVDGAAEGWLVADQLGEASVPVVFTPRYRRSPREGHEDSSGTSIEMSGILEAAGVPFALSTLSSSISLSGLAGRDLTSLPLEAAFAVRGGCSERTALAALTRIPAEILGLEDRIGSIEAGKDADLLILDGPPLDYRTYVELAIVNGKVRYDRQADRVYPQQVDE